MSALPDSERAPWYRHGYVWLLIAVPLSSVVVGVILFILATRSYDGLVADDYYRRGLQINQELGRDSAAQAAGLKALLSIDSGELRVRLSAEHAAFPAPQALRVRFSHATRAGYDRSVTLARIAPGDYRGPGEALAEGRWYVEIAAGAWRLTDVLTPPQSKLLLKAGTL